MIKNAVQSLRSESINDIELKRHSGRSAYFYFVLYSNI